MFLFYFHIFFHNLLFFSFLLVWKVRLLENYDKFKIVQTSLLQESVVEQHSIEFKHKFHDWIQYVQEQTLKIKEC
jgi:hypothetical protein